MPKSLHNFAQQALVSPYREAGEAGEEELLIIDRCLMPNTSLREAAPTTPLSTSAPCPIPNAQ